MVREVYENELSKVLELYLHLHEETIPEMTIHLDYRGKGYAIECLNYAKKIAESEKCFYSMA